jgi:hypothetical protein
MEALISSTHYKTDVHKGLLVYRELSEEYLLCFRNICSKEDNRWQKPILVCLEPVLWIAMSTRIPMIRESVDKSLSDAHVVVLAVAKQFLQHLEETWYALGNKALSGLRRSVVEHLKTKASLTRVQ